MLAANEAVARELKKRAIPTIYRVHENPDPEKLAEYREFVLSFGYKVGDLTHRAELQRLLAEIRGKPEEQALKVGLLKSLKRARYDPQPLGHYGLGKDELFAFHQSDPALCRSGRAPRAWAALRCRPPLSNYRTAVTE